MGHGCLQDMHGIIPVQYSLVFYSLTSPLLDEVLLHVVTVNLGPTEDDGLVHFVFLDGSDRILSLQNLYAFRPHLYTQGSRVTVIQGSKGILVAHIGPLRQLDRVVSYSDTTHMKLTVSSREF